MEVFMEKYGFVYIWRDKKHNRYYIGSHWGTEDDGYICSSRWMRKSYSRRSKDFRRKILARVYTNRKDLLIEEHKWLQLIKDHDIGTRYYNLTQHLNGHWATYPDKVKTISEKISIRTKEAMQRPDVRENYLKSIEGMDRTQSKETRKKRSQSIKKTFAVKYPEENRWKPLSKEERHEYYSEKAKNMHANRSEDEKKEIYKKIAAANMGKKMRSGQTNSVTHCQRISASLKGKIHERHKIMINSIIYNSTTEASKQLGISVATINRRLSSDKYSEYSRVI